MTQAVDTAQPVPTVDAAAVRPGDTVANSALLKEGADLFLEHGCLVLRNAFEPQVIGDLHAEFVAGYSHYFRWIGRSTRLAAGYKHDSRDTAPAGALTVGHKRMQITVRVERGFNSPEFYANHRIFTLLKYLLGDTMIMGSMGAVFALPGAASQCQHRDHEIIYGDATDDGTGHGGLQVLPPYAVTVMVPLVPLDELTGSTRLWLGSHLGDRVPANRSREPVVPLIALGDCYFIDYRLRHGGQPNRSKIVRPIIYNVYYRPWFRDNSENYSKSVPLEITEAELSKVPEEYRGLFEWSFAPGQPGHLRSGGGQN
jgi:ectoine hydroxylase-related dioxygenase (phytanoyl-CoA dioxygenase family)